MIECLVGVGFLILVMFGGSVFIWFAAALLNWSAGYGFDIDHDDEKGGE